MQTQGIEWSISISNFLTVALFKGQLTPKYCHHFLTLISFFCAKQKQMLGWLFVTDSLSHHSLSFYGGKNQQLQHLSKFVPQKKVVRFYGDTRVSKWRQNFHFYVKIKMLQHVCQSVKSFCVVPPTSAYGSFGPSKVEKKACVAEKLGGELWLSCVAWATSFLHYLGENSFSQFSLSGPIWENSKHAPAAPPVRPSRSSPWWQLD